jgi:hypothetical protein
MQPSIYLVSLTMTRGVCRAHFECQLCQVWEASIKDPHHWWGGFEGQSLGYRETRCPPGNFLSRRFMCNINMSFLLFFGNIYFRCFSLYIAESIRLYKSSWVSKLWLFWSYDRCWCSKWNDKNMEYWGGERYYPVLVLNNQCIENMNCNYVLQ